MQPDQAERIRKLIQDSPILTPGERIDWLDMLVLMNDKQASELEEILKAQATATKSATTEKVSQKLPPLSHISNLPQGLAPATFVSRPISPPESVSTATPTPRTPPAPLPESAASWQAQFKNTMSEKELSAPPGSKPVPTAPTPAPPMRSPTTPLQPPEAAKPLRPTMPMQPAVPPPHRRSVAAASSLETLADTGKLNLANMRNMDPNDLLIRLQQLSKMEGYFNLLSHLEDSPLYRTYINTGKQGLLDGTPFQQSASIDSVIMSKEEFETFADILRKIQVN